MNPEPSGASPIACRICGNTEDNTPYRVREMLYGTRETFDYFQCRVCGCLQIKNIPKNLGLHYPEEYTRRPMEMARKLARSYIRRFIDQRRVQHGLGGHSFIGWMANKLARPLDYISWIRQAKLSTSARILDVGCGEGRMLLRMNLGGFQHCIGVDPFIRETLNYPNGVTIHKTNLDAFSASADPFDFIMFHHALEHMSDPLKALRIATRLLSENGYIIVAVPMADSHAWEQYREDWCNIDAPRHLHIMTRTSMERLAANAGLDISLILSVATIAQFTESERYKRDIPGNTSLHSIDLFDTKRIKILKQMTEQLNREGRGDRALFFMRSNKPR